MIYPLLLCGGSGTRLWPASRAAHPKQFVTFSGEISLLQKAALRFNTSGFAGPIVMTSENFRFLAAEQLREVNVEPSTIILEPESRNTAPAILVACLWALDGDPDATMLVAPSDHEIADPNGFCRVVMSALPEVGRGQIVTVGVKPVRPETGYGYLELGQKTLGGCLSLKSFVEKPDFTTAKAMLVSNDYLWNAGISLFRAQVMVDEFMKWAPDMVAHAQKALKSSKVDLDFIRLNARVWSSLPNISIDYAIMEKAQNLSVIPYDGHWSDLGSWAAVSDEHHQEADDNLNFVSSSAWAIDCNNSYINSLDKRVKVVGIGISDMVIVATNDAVLVVPKAKSQNVRAAVDLLKEHDIPEAVEFRHEFRPWGWFESLARGATFQVKRIHVKPGGVLSLQSHNHRSEHWVVVSGEATVTVDDELTFLKENESVYVPKGSRHRLENRGTCALDLIEVQSGDYLGEDDIIRYDDVYNRD